MATINERRKFIRIKTNAHLKHVKFQMGIIVSEAPEGLAKDLSAGGIAFESNVPYEINDIVRLEIDVPGWEKFKPEFIKPGQVSKSQPIVVLVKVVRSKRLGIGKHEICVSFVGIDDGHQMALTKYIKQKSK